MLLKNLLARRSVSRRFPSLIGIREDGGARNKCFAIKSPRWCALLGILAIAVFPNPRGVAQEAPIPARIVAHVDEGALTMLKGGVPQAAQPQFDRGAVPESMVLSHIRLVLSRSAAQQAALDRYLVEVQDSSSPNYHKWLTPEQFGKLYGPSDADIVAIKAWLESHGFKIESVSPGRTNIAFSGTAGQVAAALHTPVHAFDANGNRFYSNTADVRIPSALAPVVIGIAHLNSIQPRPGSRLGRPGRIDPQTGRRKAVDLTSVDGVRPELTGGSGTVADPYFLYLVPGDAATIYNTPNATFNANHHSGSSYSGNGVTIGVAGEAIFDPTIAQTYRKNYVGDTKAPTITNVDDVSASDNTGAIGEAYLDVEVAGGIAPGAAIHFYTSTDLFGAIEQAINDNKIDIFSVSFGECEQNLGIVANTQILHWWEQAAVQGIAVTVSSGDSGSAGCEDFNTQSIATHGLQVNGLASTAYDIAVGGTDFSVDALGTTFATYAGTSAGSASTYYRTAKQYIPETTWNDSVVQNQELSGNAPRTGADANIVAGSGGVSKCSVTVLGSCQSGYSKPFWQSGAGVPADSVRDLPDVSLMAGGGVGHAAWLICTDDQITLSGGVTVSTDCTKQSDGNTYFLYTGGTSASAPAFAGILALLEEKTGDRLGQAAQQLYALSNGSHAGEIFHDIKTGNNSVPCNSGTPDCAQNTAGNYFESGYDTTDGYDLATGLGSVDATNLITYWGTGTDPSDAPAAAAVAVHPSATTITNGESLQVAVSVAGQGSSSPTPTGKVDLFTDGYDSAAQTLSGGSYNFTIGVARLTPGTHTLIVSYSGDTVYGPALSSAVKVEVTRQAPTITISPTSVRVPANEPLYLIASVSALINGSATGTLTLSGGGYTSAAQKPSSGETSFEIPANSLKVGSDVLTVSYSGDDLIAPGSSSITAEVTAPGASALPSLIGRVVAQVAAGTQHTCALTAADDSQPEAILCWGSNSHGQLGDNTTTDRALPVQIDSSYFSVIGAPSYRLIALTAGDNHNCALYSGGVWCWGANESGQVGNGTTTDSLTPVRVTDANGVVAFAAGSAHTCALLASDGSVLCWGSNSKGQLGNGSTTNSSTPVAVKGLSKAIAVAAGGNHTCALLSSGTLQCWGDNTNGQLGNGTTEDSSAPVAVKGLGGSVKSLALGTDHSCALLTDGSMQCWGLNYYSELGSASSGAVPATVTAITDKATAIGAGDNHTCAVVTDGSVHCWGDDNKAELGHMDNPGDTVSHIAGKFASVVGGGAHTCAQGIYGTLQCWGDDEHGQLGIGTTQSYGIVTPVPARGFAAQIASIAAGEDYSCALTPGVTADLTTGEQAHIPGDAYCWGGNSFGQLGNGTTDAGYRVPELVSGLSDAAVQKMAPGAFHTCALMADGTARCWGYNNNGQLGTGTATNTYVTAPVKVTGLSAATGISVGQRHTCVVLSDKSVSCWGGNAAGQLGGGPGADSASPVKVAGVSGATSLVSGVDYNCALLSDGTVSCWGENQTGQLGDGNLTEVATPVKVTGLSNVASISAAPTGTHTCALKTDGTAWCWGSNFYGQIGDGTTDSYNPGHPTPSQVTGLTSVTAIASGGTFNCALRSDKTVWCWGGGDNGELGNGSTSRIPSPVKVIGLSGTVTSLTAGDEYICAQLSDGPMQCWGENNQAEYGPSTSYWGNSSVLGSNGISTVPVPVFAGQTVSFTPPASAILGVATDLAPTAFDSSDQTVSFDEWTDTQCGGLSYGTGTGVPSVIQPREAFLCGVRALQIGGYNGHSGSVKVAPPQLRLVQVVTSTTAPKVSLNPASLDFGNVTVGKISVAKTITLSNSGDADLILNNIVIGSDSTGLFKQTNNCQFGTALSPGASCTISVTFSPKATGGASAQVVVTDNAAGSPQAASLTGTGASASAPKAALTPATADFGSVTVGSVSEAKTFTLANSGNAALPITSISITGTNAAAFKVSSNNCGASLASAATCSITVTFAPSTTGSATAALSVVDSVGTQSAALTGTGTTGAAPQATLSPATVAFGDVDAGSTSAARAITLTSGGTADLSITSISITGSDASLFHIAANTCGQTLAASQTCQINVTFQPAVAGNFSATLSVVDNAGTQTSALSGGGLALTAPQANLSPASASFGSVNVGSASTAQTFTLKNAGNAALPITSVSIGGANASLFSIGSNTCSSSLAAGGSCTIGVSFKPTAAGDAAAVLSVVDSIGTQTANLSGVGAASAPADFSITASPAQQSVQRGSAAGYTIQLVSADSSNPFTDSVALSASGLPSGASVVFSPASLVPGADKAATSTMTVTTPVLSTELKSSPLRPFGVVPAVASLAGFLLLWPLRRRRRLFHLLILLIAGLACAAGITACGSSGTGFAPPSSTSTITVTGTSGSTTHTTTVTLKIN